MTDRDVEKSKMLYSEGVIHYKNLANMIQNQSDITMYVSGFMRALLNDKGMTPEYLSIVTEIVTSEMMKVLRDK